MNNDKKNNFFDRYLNKKIILRQSKLSENIQNIICIIIYLIISMVITSLSVNSEFAGITINGVFVSRVAFIGVIAQFLTIVTAYMVITLLKKGYITSIILFCFSTVMAGRSFIINKNADSAPGIIMPVVSMILVTIIYVFSKHLNNKIEEEKRQKQELIVLYHKVDDAKEILSKQNIKLKEYNKIMKENERQLNQLAFYDVLTDLPNRKMIINRLDFLINTPNNVKQFAVVFIDLDNFKKINDTMGHHSGDILLQSVAVRLKSKLNVNDILGRLGGDEFALIIQKPHPIDDLMDYVNGLRKVLAQSFIIDKNEISISASFGIALYPQDGRDSTELLKCADTAMYKAKDIGKNGIKLFSKEMKDEIIKRIEFENYMMSAIEKNEMFLVFQPQYNADKKTLRGFETLTRWKSADLGYISPTQFIPIAEETGYIVTMGEWILRTACLQFKSIIEKYGLNIILSVNISAIQIMEPSFMTMVRSVLDETNFNTSNLEFEITESVFISSMEYVIGVMEQLKEAGIKIALDDFGTGYSSLSYLQMLPIDTLKIDKSFIDRINQKENGKQIVGSIISLVHQMDISVVAEGVENNIQLYYLQDHSCDCIQGFLWGEPLNQSDLDSLFKKLTSV